MNSRIGLLLSLITSLPAASGGMISHKWLCIGGRPAVVYPVWFLPSVPAQWLLLGNVLLKRVLSETSTHTHTKPI